ncbi:MAG: hypothetical protein L3J59_04625 [Methylococcaceae bacterium]|nr:hypothetical protein [Methylococcaceae bacterium]
MLFAVTERYKLQSFSKQLCQTWFELNNWKGFPARQLLPHGAAFRF